MWNAGWARGQRQPAGDHWGRQWEARPGSSLLAPVVKHFAIEGLDISLSPCAPVQPDYSTGRVELGLQLPTAAWFCAPCRGANSDALIHVQISVPTQAQVSFTACLLSQADEVIVASDTVNLCLYNDMPAVHDYYAALPMGPGALDGSQAPVSSVKLKVTLSGYLGDTLMNYLDVGAPELWWWTAEEELTAPPPS